MLLNRRKLKNFLQLAKQTLDIKRRGPGPAVCFTELGDSFTITASWNDTWLEYRESGEFDFSRCTLPWEGLVECSAVTVDDLTLTMERNCNIVEWTTESVTEMRSYSDGPSDEYGTFPTAESLRCMEASLIPALKEASQTATHESSRYALACLLLRGKKKDLVATDSRQLLIQKGFDWPWDDDVLIPASRCFRSAKLRQASQSGRVEIGRSEQHLVLRIGCWRMALPIVTETRFPDVDTIIPRAEDSRTTLILDDVDREFLGQTLRNLPETDRGAVTFELNGSVAVRASPEESAGRELVLRKSRKQGVDLSINTDRRYLQRVADLGLLKIELRDQNTPLVARTQEQTYVWMGFSGDPKPRPKNIEQIESPTKPTKSRSTIQPPTRKPKPMSKNGTSQTSKSQSSNESNDSDQIDQMIEQATTIKSQLKELQSELQNLITALRNQKKQARIVRSTIDSLQKLNTLQV
jgi:hypothetical protein